MGSPRTPPGTKLGRYQVVKHLTHGGMAEVLIARTSGIEGFERHIVIKRIRAEQARDDQYVRMFLDEARLAAALHHQNIVQVHDIGESDGEYFFAMEYIHGEDLRTILTTLNGRKALLPIAHLVTIITAAAAGLHHAHEQRGPDRKPLNIVHRDVSPANILVGYDGAVKVVDFGIAKAALRSAETRSGTLKGKVSYMSPEQCIGSGIDRRSDVFALGIVLYELATVRRLFKGTSDFLTMTAIVQGAIPAPSTHRPDLPDELEGIIMKALSPKPEDRYQSCEELRVALDAFADHHQLRTSSSALANQMRELFGGRAEPWLDDDAEIEILDVDFDGPGSGVVSPASNTARDLVLPPDVTPRRSSPIMKARTKAVTGAGFRVPTPVPGGVPIVIPVTTESGWGVNATAPTTASGTPMAWTPVSPSAEPTPRTKRRWPIALGVGGMLVIAGGIFFVTRSGPSVSPASTLEGPSAPQTIAPKVETSETKPDVTKPVVAKPVEVKAEVKPSEPQLGSNSPDVAPDAGSGSATSIAKKPKPRPRPTKPTSVTRPDPASRYDPKSLFPKK